ncbi:MAG: type I methionyl aminopeptidase [Deltaproteobacteria bacterium]|nr:type I methionyl aminopeptidase [Deltaproteobacteria bacterium]
MSAEERAKMRIAGRAAAELLELLGAMVRPGISTQDLDDAAVLWARARGLTHAPLGYRGGGVTPFPRSICTSVNEVVCHGIPSKTHRLAEGDIINIDVTPIVDGYHGDTSKTFLVGDAVPGVARKLVQVTEECLWRGIEAVRPGARLGDIGAAIQEHAEANGFSVVRDFAGHGVGRIFHTAPSVPHFGRRGRGLRLVPGMVFTIEPMINEGIWAVEVLDDDWTAITVDHQRSAQFEHTVAVVEDGVEVLTLP